MTCNSCKKTIYKRRKKILKTLSWRAIATTTTFCVALALTDDLSKSGVVAAVDTALKTIFYYFHEGCYDKAEKKKYKLCYDEEDVSDEDISDEDISDEDVSNKEHILNNQNTKISAV